MPRARADSTLEPPASAADEIAVVGVSVDEDEDFVTFTLAQAVPVGVARLDLEFTGTVSTALMGMYRSAYRNRTGETRYAVVTQFEATGARRCFACWDEPDLKAVFSIKITTAPHLTVLSNGFVRRADTSEDGKLRTWSFADTPIMSTYLLGIFIGEYDSISAVNENGVLTSVYAPPGRAHEGAFSVDVACKALAFYAKQFGLPYNMQKCDNICVDDMAMAAMENWGAVSYRSSWLLVDPKTTPELTRIRIALVVCHELAHQWFGNYVTMKTWTHLWLNEGFATFMEYAAADAIFPQWAIFNNFQASAAEPGFKADALWNSHPIEVEVHRPAEIDEIFDALTYDKGAAIIRMLWEYLTPAVAYAGITHYLKKYALGNASTEQLWEAMEESSGKPVRQLMARFTSEIGFPYLNVTRVDGKCVLSSGRFIAPWARFEAAWPAVRADATTTGHLQWEAPFGLDADGAHVKPSIAASAMLVERIVAAGAKQRPVNEDWVLPLSVIVGRSAGAAERVAFGEIALGSTPAERSTALAHAGERLASILGSEESWFKLNNGHAGYYRTVYDDATLGMLQQPVETKWGRPAGGDAELSTSEPMLSAVDRIGVLGDAGAAAQAGFGSFASLVRLLWAFRFETNPDVMSTAMDALSALRKVASRAGVPFRESLDAFARAFVGPNLARLGLASDDASKHGYEKRNVLRAHLFKQACIAGEHRVIAEALSLFRDHVAGTRVCPADLKAAVFHAAAVHGGADAYDSLLSIYKTVASQEDRRFAAIALGRAPDLAHVHQTLALIRAGDIGLAEADYALHAIADNDNLVEGVNAGAEMWRWFLDNEQWMREKLADNGLALADFISPIIESGNGRGHHDAALAHFTAHPMPGLARTVLQCLERVRNREWQAAMLAAEQPTLSALVQQLVSA